MSERRTELIRVRLTPTEKAAWEAAAVQEDTTVSELARKAVESHLWAAQNLLLDGTKLVDNAISTLEPEVDVNLRGTDAFSRVGSCANCGRFKEWDAKCAHCNVTLNSSTPPVRDSEDHPLSTTQSESRCPHGSPPWAFCGTCYEAGATR